MPVNGLKTLPKRCPHLPSVDLPSLDLSAEPVAIVPLALRYDFFFSSQSKTIYQKQTLGPRVGIKLKLP